ncbi:hypothetical protein PPTG_24772 [Phytophthora nicotianae INRA-310]|uniref:Uncharacterized protein n=1 Tax=Phytophthora nicotianae (strain INRA-310) TaxID=761204 RepID=W2PAW5_PHYN3|nr:hypothetical protein PPTG_24772 [Phytophthora nicotianae INRA-310]ETM97971.1 hypothetical protein PPTG_24772 [Phytophthora nicotianae INRA-310]
MAWSSSWASTRFGIAAITTKAVKRGTTLMSSGAFHSRVVSARSLPACLADKRTDSDHIMAVSLLENPYNF